MMLSAWTIGQMLSKSIDSYRGVILGIFSISIEQKVCQSSKTAAAIHREDGNLRYEYFPNDGFGKELLID